MRLLRRERRCRGGSSLALRRCSVMTGPSNRISPPHRGSLRQPTMSTSMQ